MSPGIKLGILRVVPSEPKPDDGCKDTQAFGPLHKNFTSPSHLAISPSHLAMRLPIVSVSYVFLMLARAGASPAAGCRRAEGFSTRTFYASGASRLSRI